MTANIADMRVPEQCVGTYIIKNYFFLDIVHALQNLTILLLYNKEKRSYNSSESSKSNYTNEGKVAMCNILKFVKIFNEVLRINTNYYW